MTFKDRNLAITVQRSAPGWFANQPDQTWRTVARGTAATADDWRNGKTLAESWPGIPNWGFASNYSTYPDCFSYSGGAFDPIRGEYYVHGGGHFHYPGNDVFIARIYDEKPSWVSMGVTSPGSIAGGNAYAYHNGPGQYDQDWGTSGAPQASHTYNNLCYANDRLWLPGLSGMQTAGYSDAAGSGYPDSRSTSKLFSWGRIEQKWKSHAWFHSVSEGQQFADQMRADTSSVLIPQDNEIWFGYSAYYGPDSYGAPVVGSIDATNGEVLQRIPQIYPTFLGFWNNNGVNIPGTRYILFISRNMNNTAGGAFLWNAATPTVKPVQLTVTDNSAGELWAYEICGIGWHAASNSAIITRGISEHVVQLKPNTSSYTGAWTATKRQPANVADPSREKPPTPGWDARVYNRWQVVPNMGDGRSAGIFIPDGPQLPIYVYALPNGDLT